MDFSSKYLEKAVEEIGGLPGIGKKTALRLALFLLRSDTQVTAKLANSIMDLHEKVKRCKSCGNLSDFEQCHICTNPTRDKSIVCVVEDIRDVMAIENTGQYKGIYHVLGGLVSPMDGVGPGDLNITSLVDKAASEKISEVILALSANMEGETTAFYIFKKLKQFNLPLSAIARGIAVGDQLEYADELTLARSIKNRLPYETSLNQNRS
ncbi:MAG: recombination protein RecR [Bacteroidetes bacterium]|nr:MAG: recombination protein RecR [Bacteroidota bacterium]